MDDVTQGDVVTETAGAIVDKGEDGGGGFGGGFGFRFGFATALRRLCDGFATALRRLCDGFASGGVYLYDDMALRMCASGE